MLLIVFPLPMRVDDNLSIMRLTIKDWRGSIDCTLCDWILHFTTKILHRGGFHVVVPFHAVKHVVQLLLQLLFPALTAGASCYGSKPSGGCCVKLHESRRRGTCGYTIKYNRRRRWNNIPWSYANTCGTDASPKTCCCDGNGGCRGRGDGGSGHGRNRDGGCGGHMLQRLLMALMLAGCDVDGVAGNWRH